MHKYARRQWHLIDDPNLRYRHLGAFDRDMIQTAGQKGFPDGNEVYLLHSDDGDKVLAFLRNQMVFVFNFHPHRSYSDYRISAAPGSYQIILDTDSEIYGGFNRQGSSTFHETAIDRIHRHYLSRYLPSRTAAILEPQELSINLSNRRTNEKEVV